MSGFATLIPAFTVKVNLTPSQNLTLGPVSTGAAVMIAPFAPGGGSVVSEPGYPIALNAVFEHGADYLRIDPNQKHGRIDVAAVARDVSGASLRLTYQGIMQLSEEILKVSSGSGQTTEFGVAFTHVKFEVGSEELRELETKMFVGCGRIVVAEPGVPPFVEQKISEVVYQARS